MEWLFWSIVAGTAILIALVLAAHEHLVERRGWNGRRHGGPPIQHA